MFEARTKESPSPDLESTTAMKIVDVTAYPFKRLMPASKIEVLLMNGALAFIALKTICKAQESTTVAEKLLKH
eukprot:gene8581-biopygen6871